VARKKKSSKIYPKYELPLCPFRYICPYGRPNPKEYAKDFPRYYGRRARCHYVNVFKCPFESKYPSDRKYDERWPYPIFRRLVG